MRTRTREIERRRKLKWRLTASGFFGGLAISNWGSVKVRLGQARVYEYRLQSTTCIIARQMRHLAFTSTYKLKSILDQGLSAIFSWPVNIHSINVLGACTFILFLCGLLDDISQFAHTTLSLSLFLVLFSILVKFH